MDTLREVPTFTTDSHDQDTNNFRPVHLNTKWSLDKYGSKMQKLTYEGKEENIK